MRTFVFICFAFVSCALRSETIAPNPRILRLEKNRWIKLHELKPDASGRFMRQAHGGSCFDSKRCKLVLFGSNTHGKDWMNSPRIYDPVKNEWSQTYPDDPQSTYQVSGEGIPVAGTKADHPWAMHTFGAVLYDSARDEMVIASHPGHMVPGRFTDSMKSLWGDIKRHPTWVFNFEKSEWSALPCKATSFFPYAAAFDSDRSVIIGYRPDGVYELGGETRQWKKIVRGGLFGWHNNCAYDSKQNALVVFGTNKNSNDIVAYWQATKNHRKMPTSGIRPPKDQHNPMAFVPDIGRTVILVDRTVKKDKAERDVTETWLYDLGRDEWSRLETATLPFACGMNYNMEYDPIHKVLLLVTGGYRGPTTVWALRLSGKQQPMHQN